MPFETVTIVMKATLDVKGKDSNERQQVMKEFLQSFAGVDGWPEAQELAEHLDFDDIGWYFHPILHDEPQTEYVIRRSDSSLLWEWEANEMWEDVYE